MKARLLSIGDELIAGITVDTNSAWLARRLAAMGVTVARHMTVGDERDAIADAIRESTAAADAVVITGGLGPTEDDLTREALAAVMGVALRTDDDVVRHLRHFFQQRDRAWYPSNARQAMVPVGAEFIENRWGTAPGLRARVASADVYCLPGVPCEMREMFAASVEPRISARAGGAAIVTHTVRCFGAGESNIGEQVADLMQPGRPVTVGTTAQEGVIGIRLTARATTPAEARALIERDAEEIERRLGQLVFGRDDDTLEAIVGRLLRRAGATLATTESCTGGLVAKRLTDLPGSSEYFLRGLVTYSNLAKIDLLGVDPGLLDEHGAVSEAVAEAMAGGCRQRCGVDYALATTGVAGPGGGTAAKPVGTVCIALADDRRTLARRLTLGEHLTRTAIRDRTATAVLDLLRLRLLSESPS